MRKYLNLIFLSLIFYHQASAALPKPNSAKELRYFLVEEGQANLATSVVLSTKTLYQVEQKIQLFNVLLDDHTLVLFSVLPNRNSNAPTWNEVDIIKQNVITKADLMQINENGKKTYLSSGLQDYSGLKRTDVGIVLHRKDGKYLAAQNCIVELFTLVDQEMVFPNEMGIFYINTKSPKLSAREFETQYHKLYNDYSVNAAISTQLTGSSILKSPGERPLLFLSKSLSIAGQTAYQFWSFTDWRIADGLNTHRGVDRFIYMPGKGIVGGSFDFYFKKGLHHQVTLSNYLDEKLLLPLSINDEEVKY